MSTPDFGDSPQPGVPADGVAPAGAHGLTITQESRSGAVVVQVAGEVDLSTQDTLARAVADGLRTAAAGAARLVVIDLRPVGFFGSSGLATLVESRQQAAELSVALRVVADSRSVMRIFRLTELDQVLAVHPTVEEALAADHR